MTESRRLAMPALVVGVIAVGLDAVSVAPANAAVPLDGTYTAYSDGGLGTRNDVSCGWNYPYPVARATETCRS